jgi:hypothetical protein
MKRKVAPRLPAGVEEQLCKTGYGSKYSWFNTPTRQVASNAIGVKSLLQNKIGVSVAGRSIVTNYLIVCLINFVRFVVSDKSLNLKH